MGNIRSESRKKTKTIQVRATPDEKTELKARASEFGVSVGELCRKAIFSSIPTSKADMLAVGELAALRADLGRLGGLLKGFLAGSFERQPPGLQTRDVVVKLLHEIEASQRKAVEVAQKVGKAK